MEKEFVPYGQALALVELGFNEPCFGYYDGNYNLQFTHNGILEKFTEKRIGVSGSAWAGWVSAPTFSQAFRWFREKYKLESSIQRMPPEVYGKGKGDIKNYLLYIWAENLNPRGQQTLHFDTYEEAELECLKRLIELVKQK